MVSVPMRLCGGAEWIHNCSLRITPLEVQIICLIINITDIIIVITFFIIAIE